VKVTKLQFLYNEQLYGILGFPVLCILIYTYVKKHQRGTQIITIHKQPCNVHTIHDIMESCTVQFYWCVHSVLMKIQIWYTLQYKNTYWRPYCDCAMWNSNESTVSLLEFWSMGKCNVGWSLMFINIHILSY